MRCDGSGVKEFNLGDSIADCSSVDCSGSVGRVIVGDVLTQNRSRLLSLLAQNLRCGTAVTAEHGLNQNLKSRLISLPKTE